jgi:predicted amidohydrolase
MRCLLLLCVSLAAAAGPAVTLKVAAVQFRSSFDVRDNAARIVRTLERLSAEGVRVAAFPECALTGYHKRGAMEAATEDVAAAEEQIRQSCRRLRIAAVVGSIHRVNGRTFNTAVVFNSRGELVERYGKLMLAGEKWATPGNHMALFELEGLLSTVIICHDERYPEFVRLPAMAGARLVYYISSESGLRAESKLAPYRAQIMARAVENHVYIVAANSPADPKDLDDSSHGQSRIVASDGNVLKEASYFAEESLVEALTIAPGPAGLPSSSVTAGWWKQGLEALLANRARTLE